MKMGWLQGKLKGMSNAIQFVQIPLQKANSKKSEKCKECLAVPFIYWINNSQEGQKSLLSSLERACVCARACAPVHNPMQQDIKS